MRRRRDLDRGRARVDPEDREFDVALRPRTLEEFVGQDRVKEQLALLIDGARQRGEPVDHLLFSGPPGLGKTTLAQIVAQRDGRRVPAHVRARRSTGRATSPRSSPTSRTATCCSSTRSTACRGRSRRSCIRRSRTSTSTSCSGKGPTARSIRLELPTVHAGRRDDAPGPHHAAAARALRVLAAPGLLLGRRISRRIVRRSAGILGVRDGRGRRRRDRAALARHAAHREPAAAPRPRLRRGPARRARSRATSRAPASRCSRWTRRGWTGSTTRSCARIVEKFAGGPVGLSTLAAAVGEETDTVEDVVRALPPAAGVPAADAPRPGGHGARLRHLGAHRAGHASAVARASARVPAGRLGSARAREPMACENEGRCPCS